MRILMAQVFVSPRAQEMLDECRFGTAEELIARHAQCDWGLVHAEQAEMNYVDTARNDGVAVSRFRLDTGKEVLVITEFESGHPKGNMTSIIHPLER